MSTTRKEIFHAKNYEALKGLESKYGYAFGWADKVFKARLKKRGAI